MFCSQCGKKLEKLRTVVNRPQCNSIKCNKDVSVKFINQEDKKNIISSDVELNATLKQKNNIWEPKAVNKNISTVYCPQSGCGEKVSLYSFMLHFKWQHTNVMNICTGYNKYVRFELYPTQIPYGEIQCIALIDVNNDKVSNEEPLFILMASRVKPDILPYNDVTDYSVQQNPKDEDLVVWISSNFSNNYHYTITTLSINKKCIKYYGLVKYMAHDEPIGIFLNRECLILNRQEYLSSSDSLINPVSVDIIIHNH